VFDLARLVDLGRTTHRPARPEVEDHEFDPWRARALRTLGPDDFWKLLARGAQPSLAAIFGPDLRPHQTHSAVVDVGMGQASLGCLIPSQPPVLCIRQRPNKPPLVRMELADGAFGLDLSVTDIRLYGVDHSTPDPAAVNRVAARLADGEESLLSVGLTRAYAAPGSVAAPAHYLQVNTIHLRGDPTWQLG
jgi:hypothetical protein